jgi:hypothetical protein
MIFQFFNPLDDLTVADNVVLPAGGERQRAALANRPRNGHADPCDRPGLGGAAV